MGLYVYLICTQSSEKFVMVSGGRVVVFLFLRTGACEHEESQGRRSLQLTFDCCDAFIFSHTATLPPKHRTKQDAVSSSPFLLAVKLHFE